ncbi:hypothetical protein [Reichenbachiella sp.]
MELPKLKKPLFIVCPECHIEHLIRKEFGHDILFISALGGEYLYGSIEEYEEVSQLIDQENVNQVYIVNSCGCTFLDAVISGNHFKDTSVEQTLNNLYFDHIEDLLPIEEHSERIRVLSELFMKTQGQRLLNSPFLGSKIESGELQCDGIFIDEHKELTPIDLLTTSSKRI